ncbi:MYG1 family protein [Paracraurococcus lichenis]|uniref:MYG1 family protein n=1 Tax=Paracraurococcus lichenis TaxID=3064888 RepID=A0ABT9EAI3_9PROT|nr:MYG1 family protein [Paracraurococcus sp. LOR1-02]MDO9713157.1 MYG1 family protein [Paracraurococcus sp. LOR1-02]
MIALKDGLVVAAQAALTVGGVAHGLPTPFAVYPVPSGTWMVDAMPPEPGSYAQRLPLPQAWAGLRDAALAKVSGVPDAMFVHPQRFIGGARSCAGAMTMALKAVDIGGGAAV